MADILAPRADVDPAVGPWAVDVAGDHLIVRHRDGGDPQVLAAWLRRTIHTAQATDRVCRAALLEGVLPRPQRGDIDPIVAQLRQARDNDGITARVLRDVLRFRVDGYERGAHQPFIGTVRPWAYVLGYDLTLTPRQPAGGTDTQPEGAA